MPTYEYESEKCGYHFDRFQSMTDDPVRRCPKCRCKVRRLLGTGAGIIFKGSGFYETDYRSQDYKDASRKEKPEKPKKNAEKKAKPDASSGVSDKKAADNTAK